MHRDATKAKAVAAVANYLDIEQTEIVAFGDDANDIDLLQYCGVSVAVSNAINEVTAVADHICDDNDNDGVAKWLEENVL
jgi:hydroxymethylpyrimidine pyrophosphatase-like HAD family hydrolase